ncbi:lactate 2-monooxygenase [Knoellia sp. CPCC 206453]|uniref:lactate 2-monooxygenase n=1 Tax=Knoellia pratensis TaxID=3404796 RepID=UPI0036130F60
MTEQTPSEPAIGPGRTRQSAIYRRGTLGQPPRVPTDPGELEGRARREMSAQAWAYVSGGAGAGATVRANRAAFDRWQIVPRMLHGNTTRDLRTEILGTPLAAPVMLAPVGAAELVAPDSDLDIARGASAAGTPYIFSTQGCSPMEETAKAMGDVPWWFQLYWSVDEGLVDSLIGRAEAAGAKALVVTLDTTMLGWRTLDLDLGSLPFTQGIGIAQYTSDPRFMEIVRERVAAAGDEPSPLAGTKGAEKLIAAASGARTLLNQSRRHPGGTRDNLRSAEPRAAVETFLDIYSNPGLSWAHIETLRERTRLPVLLKGILHPDDAQRAVDLGIDGIIVSNHGGRQVDRSIASLDALVSIRDRLGRDPVVLLDSGIRTGADVFVALALGADAALIGRPHIYGLALDGAKGVRDVIDNVIAELDLTMGLTGAVSIADITREGFLTGPS